MIAMDSKIDRIMKETMEAEDYEIILKMLEIMDKYPRSAKSKITKMMEEE